MAVITPRWTNITPVRVDTASVIEINIRPVISDAADPVDVDLTSGIDIKLPLIVDMLFSSSIEAL